MVASIELDVDQDARKASVKLPGVGESRIEPIVNPDISPDEHQVAIDLPNGFEYQHAEIGNSVEWSVDSGDPLSFAHENSYAQMYKFEWSNAA